MTIRLVLSRRLEFNPENAVYPLKTAWIKKPEVDNPKYPEFLASLKEPATVFDTLSASPEALIIPLINQIHIPFPAVYDKVMDYDNFFYQFIKKKKKDEKSLKILTWKNYPAKFNWEIYLDQSNHYKEELRNSRFANGRIREKALLISLPKYVWVARASFYGQLFIEVVFDATNVLDANYWKFINLYDEEFRQAVRSAYLNDDETGTMQEALNRGKKFNHVLCEELEIDQ